MEENVIINILSSQRIGIDQEEKTIEMVTEGSFQDRDNGFILCYHESEISGMEDSDTTVIVENNKVTMERTGKISAIMEFKKGEKKSSLYDTEFGNMILEIDTLDIDIFFKKNPISIDIKIVYDIMIRDVYEGTNKIHIRV